MDNDLRKLETEVTSSLRGLDPYQTQAKPRLHPEKWSIQQIVEHLLATYRGSVPVIQARVEKRRPTRARPTPRQRLGQFVITTLGRFPEGRPAPEAVSPPLPATVRCGDELARQITAELYRLEAVTAAGERLFGPERAVSHVILGPLSMRQWRRFHLIHGLHHLKQIQAIRRDHSF